MQRRDFLSLAGLALGLPAGAFAAAPAGLALPAAINKAGRQRMLSQRSAKAWLMLVLGVQPERARSLVGQAVSLFELQLAELKTLSGGEELHTLALQLEREWGRYRPLLTDLRSDPSAVWAGNEAVLGAAHKLTQACERAAGSPGARLVNLSGRQRMLSQRMAKAYFFRQMGVNSGPAGEMLEAAAKEFGRAHEELRGAPQNTPQINAELALVAQQAFFFQNALSPREPSERGRAANDVASTSERILEQMDTVVGLYEKLARETGT